MDYDARIAALRDEIDKLMEQRDAEEEAEEDINEDYIRTGQEYYEEHEDEWKEQGYSNMEMHDIVKEYRDKVINLGLSDLEEEANE